MSTKLKFTKPQALAWLAEHGTRSVPALATAWGWEKRCVRRLLELLNAKPIVAPIKPGFIVLGKMGATVQTNDAGDLVIRQRRGDGYERVVIAKQHAPAFAGVLCGVLGVGGHSVDPHGP